MSLSSAAGAGGTGRRQVSAPVPAAALRRLDSVAAGRSRSSLEDVAGTAGLVVAGFDALTEVMGCVVLHVGFARPVCGYWGLVGTGYRARTVVSGADSHGLLPAGRAVDRAWGTALARLLAEAALVGADGVVGITATRRPIPGSATDVEFVMLGTAVRARSATRSARPFATDLSGGRFAALIRSGWIPTGFAIRVAQGIRHDDWQTRSALSQWTANVEVDGLTELVTRTREDARRGFTARMSGLGGEAAVVSSMTLRTWHQEAGENHVDHLAEAMVAGTALVCFDPAAAARAGAPLTMMPLTDPPPTGGQGIRSAGNAAPRAGGRR